MACITCQVLQRPDRVTFIWSQDNASFEPYHLTGSEAEQFYRLAGEARQHLASVLAGDNAQLALARSGYELHQLIFRARESDAASARRIHQWLHDLHEQKSIDSLEIVSDVPGRIPWNLVCEQAPEGTPDLQAFWGVRYPLTTGRRVNPLRLAPIFAEQEVLLVLDPALSPQQQEAWKESAGTDRIAGSAAQSARGPGDCAVPTCSAGSAVFRTASWCWVKNGSHRRSCAAGSMSRRRAILSHWCYCRFLKSPIPRKSRPGLHSWPRLAWCFPD